jgi:hypothetical protein
MGIGGVVGMMAQSTVVQRLQFAGSIVVGICLASVIPQRRPRLANLARAILLSGAAALFPVLLWLLLPAHGVQWDVISDVTCVAIGYIAVVTAREYCTRPPPTN